VCCVRAVGVCHHAFPFCMYHVVCHWEQVSAWAVMTTPMQKREGTDVNGNNVAGYDNNANQLVCHLDHVDTHAERAGRGADAETLGKCSVS
jgi:hypothetical protein